MAFPSAADFQFTDEHRFLCGLSGLEFERVTQISQMTQIFLTYSVRFTQTFTFCTNSCPTDSTDSHRFFDLFGQTYADFSTPLPPSAKRGALSHSQALALTIRARDVAGDAIALPEFWSASGACALKGWPGCLISIFLSRPGPSSRRGFLTPSLLASSLPSLSCPQ